MASPSLSTAASLNKDSSSTNTNSNNNHGSSIRKYSNASSSMGGGSLESETGRLLNSLGSVGSSLPDVGTGTDCPSAPAAATAPTSTKPTSESAGASCKKASDDAQAAAETAAILTSTASTDDNDDATQFQVPAAVPQHHQLKFAGSTTDDPNIQSSLPKLSLPTEESGSLSSSKGSSRNLPERRLPSKKRKMSCESYGSAILGDMSLLNRKRKMSCESYGSAMGDSYMGLATLDSGIQSAIVPKLPDIASVNTKGSKGSGTSDNLPLPAVSALEHLDALGDDGAELPTPGGPVVKIKPPDEGSASKSGGGGAGPKDDHSDGDATFTSSGHRILMEAIMMTSGGAGGEGVGRRKRFESWGGMSDLSVQMGGTDQAAAIAASALHHTGIIDDVTAAANFGGGSVASSVTDDHLVVPKPPSASADAARSDRRDRTASLSDSTFPVPSSLDGLEISSDLQKFVAAAVASVGDQLAELAGNIESAAAAVDLDKTTAKDDDTRQGSEVSSIATPMMLGATLDELPRIPLGDNSSQPSNQDRSVNAGISVDYDAVAAAVDAAQAATGDLDLSAIEGAITIHGPISSTASSISSGPGAKAMQARRRRKLPTQRKKASMAAPPPADMLKEVPKSSLSEKEQEEIRERARKAAGYVPPSQSSTGNVTTPTRKRLPPLKKRKAMTPDHASTKSNAHVTPKTSNTSGNVADKVPSIVVSAAKPQPASSSKSGNKEKSTAKWDGMYDCLIQFIKERKEEETMGATEEEIAEWTWDGNVPTTYKTKDGKALGRWINNQRSAKSKGTLKEEREARLVNAGLKWSVLASNSWNEMLDELRIYIAEYTKHGKPWDGNVPTNYRIKARANGKKMSEDDKNLGRWVNRQRSLYQAGKLRKDRQLALEQIGLKWSMLATTSWDAMFDTLVEYVKAKESNGAKWDGNVPANYRTDDHPPRALGRWINRQRSAHVKKKLKQEYVDKLSKLGLKWSVHERRFADEPRSNENVAAAASMPQSPSQPAAPKPAPVASTSMVVPATIAFPAKQSAKAPAAAAAAPPSNPAPVRVTSVRFDDEKKDNQGTTKASKPQPKAAPNAVVVDCSVKIVDPGNAKTGQKQVASQPTSLSNAAGDKPPSKTTTQAAATSGKPSAVAAKS